MKKTLCSIPLFALVIGAAPGSGACAAEPLGTVTIQLPAEHAQYKPGPGVEVVRRHCTSCHSADYVYMQPPLTEAQWRATVAKMKNAMKAPIADGDVDAIVRYLMSQNGRT
ncbi:MAG TPA: cytochrome c [Chromatiales bacterium]|nr:cytochrome c [Chromatiales bacterium]